MPKLWLSCGKSSQFLQRRAKFGDMDASMASDMKSMTKENRRLKRMHAKMSMQNDLLKDEKTGLYAQINTKI